MMLIQHLPDSCINKLNANKFTKAVIFGLLIAMGTLNSGCSKEDTGNRDEYYVKYEVSSTTIYYGGKLNVEINKENNRNENITINTRTNWEAVIGPVKKGFEATLSVSEIATNHGNLRLYTQISVSKNGSPFTLKQIDRSETPRTSVQTKYKIDY